MTKTNYPPKSPVSVPELPGYRFSRLLRNGLFSMVILAALTMGINPADYDPYNDNDHATYYLLAAALPLPQGVPQPCWGADARCPDGKYRDRFGKEQPESCANDYAGPDTGERAHSCRCARATNCPEMPGNGGEPPPQVYEGPDCWVNCRGNHCHCTSECESTNHPDGKMPENCPMNHA